MDEEYYTLAMWKVQSGREAEFQAAWQALGAVFAGLTHPPKFGTLLQSLSDPTLFYSFGPWHSREDIALMRGNPQAQQAFQQIMALCSEATPGDYRVVAHIEV